MINRKIAIQAIRFAVVMYLRDTPLRGGTPAKEFALKAA